MTKLSPVTRREFIRRLQSLGFTGPYGGGRHAAMRSRDGRVKVAIPNPHGDVIGPPLLSKLLRESGMSREEWERL